MVGEAFMVASAAAASPGTQVAAESAEEGAGVLFTVLGLDVTSAVTTTWGIMVLLVVISLLATHKMSDVPGFLQNAVEAGLEWMQNFFGDVLGEERLKKYFPFLATLFIFVCFSNYSGMIPGAGHLPGLSAPTSSLSVTAALAIIVFVATHFLGFQVNHLGYLKHFISPVAFMLPFLLIEEAVRPVSLALRLYGNIFGEETVTAQIFGMVPFLVPILMQALSLLFCFIQAMVFALLAAIYIEGSTSKLAH